MGKTTEHTEEISPVRQRRTELGLTQLQVAILSGVTPTTIANIENGRYKDVRLSPRQFKGICRALKWATIEEVPDEWLPPMANQN